jgi:hydrogenase nickel incorporation protein HypA/HybF
MHEASLARRLLAAVLERAAAAGAARVRTVTGWVAEVEALSPESLAFHFAAHAPGTAAEGARLELRLIRVEARCRGCGRTYAPDHHLMVCPGCGSTEGELLGRTGVGLDALEVDS